MFLVKHLFKSFAHLTFGVCFFMVLIFVFIYSGYKSRVGLWQVWSSEYLCSPTAGILPHLLYFSACVLVCS